MANSLALYVTSKSKRATEGVIQNVRAAAHLPRADARLQQLRCPGPECRPHCHLPLSWMCSHQLQLRQAGHTPRVGLLHAGKARQPPLAVFTIPDAMILAAAAQRADGGQGKQADGGGGRHLKPRARGRLPQHHRCAAGLGLSRPRAGRVAHSTPHSARRSPLCQRCARRQTSACLLGPRRRRHLHMQTCVPAGTRTCVRPTSRATHPAGHHPTPPYPVLPPAPATCRHRPRGGVQRHHGGVPRAPLPGAGPPGHPLHPLLPGGRGPLIFRGGARPPVRKSSRCCAPPAVARACVAP